jgi:hypothetical protein
MLPDIETKVPVTETVPLIGTTFSSLLEQMRTVFAGTHRVSRFVYARGEPLRIERMVPQSVADAGKDAFVTPWQYARQHSRILIEYGDGQTPLHTLCAAITRCRDEKAPARFLLCRQASRAGKWVFGNDPFSLATVFSLPVLEDPETPDGCLIVCGSATGDMISDTELSVVCEMRA